MSSLGSPLNRSAHQLEHGNEQRIVSVEHAPDDEELPASRPPKRDDRRSPSPPRSTRRRLSRSAGRRSRSATYAERPVARRPAGARTQPNDRAARATRPASRRSNPTAKRRRTAGGAATTRATSPSDEQEPSRARRRRRAEEVGHSETTRAGPSSAGRRPDEPRSTPRPAASNAGVCERNRGQVAGHAPHFCEVDGLLARPAGSGRRAAAAGTDAERAGRCTPDHDPVGRARVGEPGGAGSAHSRARAPVIRGSPGRRPGRPRRSTSRPPEGAAAIRSTSSPSISFVSAPTKRACSAGIGPSRECRRRPARA